MSTNKWTYDKFKYDPWTYASYKEGDSVKEALKKRTDAENAMANYGDFIFSKQGEYDSLYDQYKNRGDFTYDLNGDALYQQYKDKYIQQGKLAMADTMGQAAAMTGGYGNSYAQSVGQQAYQASLDNLNDIVPELYAMALDRYNQKGQDSKAKTTTTTNPTNEQPEKEPEHVETAADYADWSALDWEGYFAQIRNGEGGSKAEAEEELNRMIKAGLIPQKMIYYASIGARGKAGH